MTPAELLKYPVGKFQVPLSIDEVDFPFHINVIAEFPEKLREVTGALNDTQLDTPYREGGWTVRQVVHHCADSHINSYCRFKLAMSETNPVIKPYFEEKWAEMADAKSAPIFYSLNILDAVHDRWVLFLRTLNEDDFRRTYFHPANERRVSLFESLAMYSWHCVHHLAHITSLKKRMNW